MSVPPGWPADLVPPAAPDFERRAVAWLLDLLPPDYRSHEVLRRHPVVLVRLAREHVEASVAAARRGLATVRADLRGVVAPDVVEAAVSAYEVEGLRLARVARSLPHVEAALRGQRWVPRL